MLCNAHWSIGDFPMIEPPTKTVYSSRTNGTDYSDNNDDKTLLVVILSGRAKHETVRVRRSGKRRDFAGTLWNRSRPVFAVSVRFLRVVVAQKFPTRVTYTTRRVRTTFFATRARNRRRPFACISQSSVSGFARASNE